MKENFRQVREERLQRFNDAVQLKRPDRVPIATFTHYFIPRYSGLTNRAAWYEPEKMADAFVKAATDFRWDMAAFVGSIMSPGKAMETLGFSHMKWPGHGLPENAPHQYVEAEHMLAGEYDEFLRNPGDFTVRRLLPRISSAVAPLAYLPPLQTLYPTYMYALPNLIDSLRTMISAAEELRAWQEFRTKTRIALEEAGFPSVGESICFPPFDQFSDYYRGLKGSTLDMFRRPDKLLAAIEVITEPLIERVTVSAKASGNPRVFIPMHRGAAGFMSNEQFARFYWPSTKRLFLALIDAGLTPMPWFEGDYTPRLEFLAELPRGKVAAHMDIVDVPRFKEVLGDTMCFWGNIPAQLFVAGTPAQITDYVRMLIDTFGDTGALIVDGAVAGIPDEAKVENAMAMTEAVYKYGVFK